MRRENKYKTLIKSNATKQTFKEKFPIDISPLTCLLILDEEDVQLLLDCVLVLVKLHAHSILYIFKYKKSIIEKF